MLFGPVIYENPESRSQNPGGKALKSVIQAPDSWLLAPEFLSPKTSPQLLE
jgi:hypothetical protein